MLNIKTNEKKTIKINENKDNHQKFLLYGNNEFIIIYPNGDVYKSADGYKWSKLSNVYDLLEKSKHYNNQNRFISDIKYFNGRYYIANGEADCIVSSNLLQFDKIDFTEYSYMYFNKFFVSGGTIYLCGGDNQNYPTYYVLSSTDGLNWGYDSQLEGEPSDIVKYNNHEYILAYGDKFYQYNNLIIDGKAYNNKPLKESPGSFIEFKKKLCLLGSEGKIWSFSFKGNNISYSLVTTVKFNDDNLPFPGGGRRIDEGILFGSPTNAYIISKDGDIKSLSSDKSRPGEINQCFWNGSKCCFYHYDEYQTTNSMYYETSDGKNFNLVQSPVKKFNQVISSKAGLLFHVYEDNLYFSNGKGVCEVELPNFPKNNYCPIYMNSWHNGFVILKEYNNVEDGTVHLLVYSTDNGAKWKLNSDLSEGKCGFQKVLCDGNSIIIIINDNNGITAFNSKNLSSWSKNHIQGSYNTFGNLVEGAGKTKEGYFVITENATIFKSADGVKWAKIMLLDQITKSDSGIDVTNCSFCYDGYMFEVSKSVNKKSVGELWVYRNGSFSKLQIPDV